MFARAAARAARRAGVLRRHHPTASSPTRGLRHSASAPATGWRSSCPTRPQHVVAFYAVLRLGAVVVEHNPLYTATELATMFADHGARVAIAWDVAVPKLPAVEHVVAVNLLEAFPTVKRLALHLPVPKLAATRKRLHAKAPGTTPWKQLVAHKPIRNWAEPTASDLAVIQYTSGTTGAFKGAMLTHRNLYANALQGAAWMKDAKDGKRDDLRRPADVPRVRDDAVPDLRDAQAGPAGAVPDVRRRHGARRGEEAPADGVLRGAADLREDRPPRAIERKVSLKSAKFCISGAMKLTDPVVELWESVSGGLLVEGYGLTETSPVALGNPFWPTRRTGTIGVPFPSTLMRVVDPDDPTREVAQGEEGELLLKGPQVFAGYWNAPQETAKALLPDGWLRTGDIVVVVDADGFTTIVDRLKEIIVTGGFNVSPSEVEHVLVEHPDIDDVAVVGLQTESGEQVAAAVVLRGARTWTWPRSAPGPRSGWPPTRCRARSSRSRNCPSRCWARCCASRSARRSPQRAEPGVGGGAAGPHSHSMVPGGLLVMSSTTRLTSRTSLVMRVEIGLEQVVRQARPVGGHGVLAGDRAQHDRVAVGAAVALDADAADVGQQHHGELPDVLLVAGRRQLLAGDRVGLAEEVEALAGDLADDADAEARAGERLAPDHLVRAGPARSPTARTSSLNRVRSGSMSVNCRSSGRPPTLWWLLMLAAPSPPPDSTTSG